MEGWTARDVAAFRHCLDLSQEQFGVRVGVSVATVRRCETGGVITSRVQHRLDALLAQVVAQVAAWFPAGKVKDMRRRDVLRLVSTGVLLPLGGIPALPVDGAPPRMGAGTLDSLEAGITGLASTYHTSSSRVLLAPTVAYLDEAFPLLGVSMLPEQRSRLQAILADIAVFAGP